MRAGSSLLVASSVLARRSSKVLSREVPTSDSSCRASACSGEFVKIVQYERPPSVSSSSPNVCSQNLLTLSLCFPNMTSSLVLACTFAGAERAQVCGACAAEGVDGMQVA